LRPFLALTRIAVFPTLGGRNAQVHNPAAVLEIVNLWIAAEIADQNYAID
jgi:hypothetical protein